MDQTNQPNGVSLPAIVVDERVQSPFEDPSMFLSPRETKQRFVAGYLEHRCKWIGWIKTFKSKYFRLRDHGLIGYFIKEDTTPCLELLFRPETQLELNSSLQVLVLDHIEVIETTKGWFKVDEQVILKASNALELEVWHQAISKKLRARQLAQEATLARLSATSSTLQSVNSGVQQLMENQTKDQADEVLYSCTEDPLYYHIFHHKYQMLNEIGEGSFSVVRKAVNRLTGELCSAKCSKHTPLLLEEVNILKQLQNQPNIINIHGVYKHQEMLYIVMDYMQHGDLCDHLITTQRITEQETKEIIGQVLCGLEKMHAMHIVHRDIKPENLLLASNLLVKIADFGLARQLQNETATLVKSCGTPEYAAPELLSGLPYNTKVDIFSLGIVAYVFLFGSFPFTVASATALQELDKFPKGVDIRDMSCLNPLNPQWQQVSAAAQDIILKMLAKNPAERITASELLRHPWFFNIEYNSTQYQKMEQLRLEYCVSNGWLEIITTGIEVTKFNKNGNKKKITPSHRTTLKYNFQFQTLHWTKRPHAVTLNGAAANNNTNNNDITSKKLTSPQNSTKQVPRCIKLQDIQNIVLGHQTNAFLNVPMESKIDPNLCFSILTPYRTLDVAVDTISQHQYVTAGLMKLVQDTKGVGQ